MAEDGDEVIGRDDFIWDELVEALKPRDGEVLVYAAKRCAAKAHKFDEWRWRIREYQRWWRDHWRNRELQKLNLKETQVEARMISQHNSALRREVRNWKHKAEKIARALGIREGETLVAAAERVAWERGEWKKVKEYWETRQVKKLEDAEAEAARLKKALEDQAVATEQGRELVGPWIVERDEWKARAASFERIANELQAQLKAQTFGMSTAKVEPHSEPPTAWE